MSKPRRTRTRPSQIPARRLVVEGTALQKVTQAMANDTRLLILSLLSRQVMNLTELTEALGMPASTVSFHIKRLEEAELLHVEYVPGTRGAQKLISKRYDELLLTLPGAASVEAQDELVVSMPVGNYTAVRCVPSCGLASESKIIGMLDDPRSFFEPEHVFAQILWLSDGYVEYAFPNNLPYGTEAKELELSLELCSEAPHFAEVWPSDITLWVNDVEIGTWTSPGDFGGVRAPLTPAWWATDQTTYGLLKRWRVTQEGSWIDGEVLSDVVVPQLNLSRDHHIKVRLGIKEKARHRGGMNLFGRHFGNYPQDIVLRVGYTRTE